AVGYTKDHLETWQDLLDFAPKLKAAGNPVGCAVSQTSDAEHTWRSLMWSHGAAEFSADGKTVAIDSPEPRTVLNMAKTLYARTDGCQQGLQQPVPKGASAEADAGARHGHEAHASPGHREFRAAGRVPGAVVAGGVRRAEQPPRDGYVRELHHREEEHRRHDRRREEASAGLTHEVPRLIHDANGPARRGMGRNGRARMPGHFLFQRECGFS